MRFFLDADACPVKEEAYRVAARYDVAISVVACQPMRQPPYSKATLTVVPAGPDLADDWIVEHIEVGDICVTDDIPLAARCVKKGALVVNARGRLLHEGNIGETLATRDLLEQLRNTGILGEGGGGGGPAPFTKRDRSRFLDAMEQAVRKLRKGEQAVE